MPDIPAEAKNEAYWNCKHPYIDQIYQGRPAPDKSGQVAIDVRHFVWADDLILRKTIEIAMLKGATADECALNVQRYVVQVLKYIGDDTIGSSEYWLFPNETLAMKKGDCEDGAILIASLLLCLLDPKDHWRVRVAAGFVKAGPAAAQGGHAYCTYCRMTDNEWVALDWCYYPDQVTTVASKPMIKNVSFYKDVWFSFNHLHAWSHVNFAMKGRVRG